MLAETSEFLKSLVKNESKRMNPLDLNENNRLSNCIGWRNKITKNFIKRQKTQHLKISKRKNLKWGPHVTKRERNDIITMLTFPIALNKRFGRKLPLVRESTITVNFRKNCFTRKIL